MQQIYNFKKADFDNNGFQKDGKLFSDLIFEWEVIFNSQFSPYFANYIYANNSSMLLIKSCFVTEENEDFGMDGEFDLETNIKIETYSKRQTTYALCSHLQGNKDEPLFLVIDDKISDGVIIFKYVPDDDGDESSPIETIDTRVKIKV